MFFIYLLINLFWGGEEGGLFNFLSKKPKSTRNHEYKRYKFHCTKCAFRQLCLFSGARGQNIWKSRTYFEEIISQKDLKCRKNRTCEKNWLIKVLRAHVSDLSHKKLVFKLLIFKTKFLLHLSPHMLSDAILRNRNPKR